MQTQLIRTEDHEAIKNEWVQSLDALIGQLTDWAADQQWTVTQTPRVLREEELGEYSVTDLSFDTPQGKLVLEARPRGFSGRPGRVEFYAYPSLYRVLLLQGEQGEWRIRTDSGIQLRQPWNEETFVTLSRDLLMAE